LQNFSCVRPLVLTFYVGESLHFWGWQVLSQNSGAIWLCCAIW
jgi:hypothetical protein